MTAFNILTVNLHMGFSAFRRRFVLPALREAIRGVSADLVLLQEVLGAHERHAARHRDWPTATQYEFLADTLWPQFAYGRNAVYPHGHHGNAVLSKFPIASWTNRDVSVQGHEQRGLLHTVLRLPGHEGEVHAICVHLGLREAHRQRQIGLLCELVAQGVPAGAPLVVAGDFNDWRRRGHAALRDCGLVDAHEHLHGQLARSFPSRWPVLPLDRLYLRNARVLEARVLGGRPWSNLSDHVPLLARIAL